MEKMNNGKIVITGMGAVTPIGIGVEEYWKALVEGKTGVAEIDRFDTTNLPVKIAAMVKDFDAAKYMDKKLAREMEPFMQYGYVAADEALRDAGIDPSSEEPVIAPERIGIVFGSVFAGITNVADTQEGLTSGEHTKTNPRFITKIIGNIGAAQIAIAKGLHGPSYTVSTACSSGLDTVSMGAMLIKEDLADAVICVGGEAATCPLTILGLSGTHALSQRNDDPFLNHICFFMMACRIAGHLFLSVQVKSDVKAYIHRRLESPEHIVVLVVCVLLHVLSDPVGAEVPVQVNRCGQLDG